ncbi:hypothetical protein JNK13_04085 [bacterium]|nr:hypothetical protein [bacterium]
MLANTFRQRRSIGFQTADLSLRQWLDVSWFYPPDFKSSFWKRINQGYLIYADTSVLKFFDTEITREFLESIFNSYKIQSKFNPGLYRGIRAGYLVDGLPQWTMSLSANQARRALLGNPPDFLAIELERLAERGFATNFIDQIEITATAELDFVVPNLINALYDWQHRTSVIDVASKRSDLRTEFLTRFCSAQHQAMSVLSQLSNFGQTTSVQRLAQEARQAFARKYQEAFVLVEQRLARKELQPRAVYSELQIQDIWFELPEDQPDKLFVLKHDLHSKLLPLGYFEEMIASLLVSSEQATDNRQFRQLFQESAEEYLQAIGGEGSLKLLRYFTALKYIAELGNDRVRTGTLSESELLKLEVALFKIIKSCRALPVHGRLLLISAIEAKQREFLGDQLSQLTGFEVLVEGKSLDFVKKLSLIERITYNASRNLSSALIVQDYTDNRALCSFTSAEEFLSTSIRQLVSDLSQPTDIIALEILRAL